VVTPEGVRPASVLVADGRIADVLPHDRVPMSGRIDDFGERIVMPGLVDIHVHINEPGRTEWEGFETATQAAAAGGITTLVDMPLNSTPVTVSVEALQKKRDAARGRIHVDCGFHGGLVPGHEKDIAGLLDAGVIGIKAFLVHSGIDDFPAATEKELRAAMPVLAKRGVPLLVHAELARAAAGAGAPRLHAYADYLASRPRAWENEAIELMIRLCREYRCPVHIVHLSSSDALAPIIAARDEGLPLTVESCPHYLFFRSEDIRDGDARFKCAPPIREGANNEALWNGLKRGAIDLIATDHSPCPPAMKRLEDGDFAKAWGGISSLQLSLPAAWTAARGQGISIESLARWMSTTPARLAGLGSRKGAIARGYDADFVVWEPDVAFTVHSPRLYHRHKVTPYEGRVLYGVVERTYLGGRRIAEEGVTFAEPSGKLLARADSPKQP
jgi:allantoinase